MSELSFRDLLAVQRSIEDQIVDNQGEVTNDLFEKIIALNQATPEKVESIIGFLDHCESKAEEWKKKADKLYERASMYSNTLEKCKDYVKSTMVQMNYDEILGNDFKICVENGGTSVDVFNEHEVPSEFIILKPTVEKKRVKEALQGGIPVPGAKLVSVKRLMIRAAEKKKRTIER